MYRIHTGREQMNDFIRYYWPYMALLTIGIFFLWQFVFFVLTDVGVTSINLSFVNVGAPTEEQMQPITEQLLGRFPWALKVNYRDYYPEGQSNKPIPDDLLMQFQRIADSEDPKAQMGILIFDQADFDVLMKQGKLVPLEKYVDRNENQHLYSQAAAFTRVEEGNSAVYALPLEDFSILGKVELTERWRRGKAVGIGSATLNKGFTGRVISWLIKNS